MLAAPAPARPPLLAPGLLRGVGDEEEDHGDPNEIDMLEEDRDAWTRSVQIGLVLLVATACRCAAYILPAALQCAREASFGKYADFGGFFFAGWIQFQLANDFFHLARRVHPLLSFRSPATAAETTLLLLSTSLLVITELLQDLDVLSSTIVVQLVQAGAIILGILISVFSMLWVKETLRYTSCIPSAPYRMVVYACVFFSTMVRLLIDFVEIFLSADVEPDFCQSGFLVYLSSSTLPMFEFLLLFAPVTMLLALKYISLERARQITLLVPLRRKFTRILGVLIWSYLGSLMLLCSISSRAYVDVSALRDGGDDWLSSGGGIFELFIMARSTAGLATVYFLVALAGPIQSFLELFLSGFLGSQLAALFSRMIVHRWSGLLSLLFAVAHIAAHVAIAVMGPTGALVNGVPQVYVDAAHLFGSLAGSTGLIMTAGLLLFPAFAFLLIHSKRITFDTFVALKRVTLLFTVLAFMIHGFARVFGVPPTNGILLSITVIVLGLVKLVEKWQRCDVTLRGLFHFYPDFELNNCKAVIRLDGIPTKIMDRLTEATADYVYASDVMFAEDVRRALEERSYGTQLWHYLLGQETGIRHPFSLVVYTLGGQRFVELHIDVTLKAGAKRIARRYKDRMQERLEQAREQVRMIGQPQPFLMHLSRTYGGPLSSVVRLILQADEPSLESNIGRPEKRSVLLLGFGVGVTPILSSFDAILTFIEGEGCRFFSRVFFVYVSSGSTYDAYVEDIVRRRLDDHEAARIRLEEQEAAAAARTSRQNRQRRVGPNSPQIKVFFCAHQVVSAVGCQHGRPDPW
jgi:hypothetical protein